MRYPAIQYPSRIARESLYNAAERPDGGYGPARPIPYESPNFFKRLVHRIRLAWGCFTGRYDALDWQEE